MATDVTGMGEPMGTANQRAFPPRTIFILAQAPANAVSSAVSTALITSSLTPS